MATNSLQTRDDLLRGYAAGSVSWRALQDEGFEDYIQVLAGLAELGLRQPLAAMDGPNLEARARGRALLQRLLRDQPRP
jgi:hypothetical protein